MFCHSDYKWEGITFIRVGCDIDFKKMGKSYADFEDGEQKVLKMLLNIYQNNINKFSDSFDIRTSKFIF